MPMRTGMAGRKKGLNPVNVELARLFLFLLQHDRDVVKHLLPTTLKRRTTGFNLLVVIWVKNAYWISYALWVIYSFTGLVGDFCPVGL